MTAAVLEVGPVQLHIPGRTLNLSAEHWAKIECAIVWAERGFAEQSKGLLGEVEGELAEEVRARIRRSRSERAAGIAVRKEPTLTKDMARRLAKADHKACFGGKQGKAQAREIVREVGDQLKAREESAALQEHIEALGKLEGGRGGEVSVSRAGAIRVSNRDGLQNLLASGALVPVQYYAGLKYRDLVEALREPLGSQLDDRKLGAGGEIDPEREQRRQRARQAKERELVKVEAMVTHKAQNGRGLTALRLVAGEGRAVAQFGGSGTARALYTKALAGALDVLADHWGLQ